MKRLPMKRLLLLIILSAFLWTSTAVPADPPASKAQPVEKGATPEPSVKTATLKVGNRSIFTFREPFSGTRRSSASRPAEARLKAVIERGAWER